MQLAMDEGRIAEYVRDRFGEDEITKILDLHRKGVYKDSFYTNIVVHETLKKHFDRLVYKTDSAVKHIIAYKGNSKFFIAIEGITLKNICKVSNNFKYFINGQVTKGALKGYKKDRELIATVMEEFDRLYALE